MSLPTPYYDHDGITIYHGDCREILPFLRADVLTADVSLSLGHFRLGSQPTAI